MTIQVNDSGAFVQSLLNSYVEDQGFGQPTKSQLDILLFHLLMKHTKLAELDNHQLSLELKLTPQRVANLRHQADLQYQEDADSFLKDQLPRLLRKAKIENDHENRILINVEDRFLRQCIEGVLSDKGHLSDSSFNRNVLRVGLEAFVALLEHVLDDRERKTFVTKAKKVLKKSKSAGFKKLAMEVLTEYAKGAASKAGSQTVDLLTGNIGGVGELLTGLLDKICETTDMTQAS